MSSKSKLSSLLKSRKSEPSIGGGGKEKKESSQKETTIPSSKKPSGDARFASFATDPRFRGSGSSKNGGNKKVEVDKRFKAMFEDDEFQIGKKAKVDKYGRKINAKSKDTFGDLSRHYKLTEDEEVRLEELNKLARGGNSEESSSEDEEEENESGSDLDVEDEDDVDEETGKSKSDELLTAQLGTESSNRLAVVGCDWDHIRAVDILAVLQSFVPSTGAVLDVAVYSSEFGRTQMAQEETEGPFAQYKLDMDKAGNDDERESAGDDEEDDDINSEDEDVTDKGAGYNPELLRKYEKERLLYYFAVVTCDSISTAETLYQECDGLEFEKSAVGLDLRFVPDDAKFDVSTLRDRASDVPESYAPIDFVNRSLQQTRVDLTWDEPEYDRRKLTEWGSMLTNKKKDPRIKGVPLDELEAFIASDQSDVEDSEEEEEKRKQDVQRYRNLLLKSTKTSKAKDEEEEEEEAEGEDFFVENEESDQEEPVKAKKTKSKSKSKDAAVAEEEEADTTTATQTIKPKDKTKRSRLFVEENQLGLDNNDKKKPTKKGKFKGDAKEKKLADDEEDVNVELDVKDERFASLFSEPEYAFDRTDPKFKSTETTRKIEEERRKRMQQQKQKW